jgi:transposase
LDLIADQAPDDVDVHVILDNASTHKTPAIERWLRRHPRFELHFTPTSSSWLNLVERCFAELTNKKLRRVTRTLKLENEILQNLARYCQRTINSGH